jgi:SPP1 family phage portal protein
MLFKGRSKIQTEYKSINLRDIDNLAGFLNITMSEHMINKHEIDYLVDYRKGLQPILNKVKEVRPEINNKLVINHAQMVTRTIVGYFLGNPIQYIQSGTNKKEEIDILNKYVSYEDKYSVDQEIGEYQSICGTAYRIIFTDGVFGDEVPFEDKALDPATTYVAYENSIAEKPVAGVTYYNTYNPDQSLKGVRIYVYTDFGVYDILTDSTGNVNDKSEISFSPYNVGGVPIIEYPNNIWRIGDWELCLLLMDSINALYSGRLDDVDQIVQSLLVFLNVEIDADTYDELRESGIIQLNSLRDKTPDIKSVNTPLDQTGMSSFAEEMEALLYAILGIPDRKSRSGGGGDTGQAVELRDGWADLEIVARSKELVFKKAEKQALRIILKILNNKEGLTLSLLDVDIKFTRNKNNNLLVKTQSYNNLLSSRTLSPEDCLTIVDLVSDVNEFISRGKEFWGENFANLNVNTKQATDNIEQKLEKNMLE